MTELGCIGFANHNRTGGAEPRNFDRIRACQVVAESPGAVGGRHLRHVFEVLYGDRHACQGADRFAPRDALVPAAGFGHRLIAAHGAERAEAPVKVSEGGYRRGGRLARLDLALADEGVELDRSYEVEIHI